MNQTTDVQLQKVKQNELYCGDTMEDAKQIIINILNNESTIAQKSTVVANAGFAIKTIEPNLSMEACFAKAEESIASGKAMEVLKTIINK